MMSSTHKFVSEVVLLFPYTIRSKDTITITLIYGLDMAS